MQALAAGLPVQGHLDAGLGTLDEPHNSLAHLVGSDSNSATANQASQKDDPRRRDSAPAAAAAHGGTAAQH